MAIFRIASPWAVSVALVAALVGASEVLSLDDDEGLVGPGMVFGAMSSDDSCDGRSSRTSSHCALMALQLRASLEQVEVQAHSSDVRASREDAGHERIGPSICFPNYETLPDAWRPSKELEAQLRSLPSPPHGQGLDRAAEAAARGAYGELVSLIRRPGNVKKLGTDALDAVLIGASAGGNMPDIQRTSLLYSRDILIELSGVVLNASADHGKCDSLFESDLSILVGYGHYLTLQLPQNSSLDATHAALEKLANLAVADCGRQLKQWLSSWPSLGGSTGILRTTRAPLMMIRSRFCSKWPCKRQTLCSCLQTLTSSCQLTRWTTSPSFGPISLTTHFPT
ncbi:unnamed protein product [Polarella glacialis]|uniref:Phospholipase B-like n=1 Tax=Polarella glacialis TaxID=89957 RepID=A0A813FHL4_POLGL|nr:unnamed protein product [Polarella glacialis]